MTSRLGPGKATPALDCLFSLAGLPLKLLRPASSIYSGVYSDHKPVKSKNAFIFVYIFLEKSRSFSYFTRIAVTILNVSFLTQKFG